MAAERTMKDWINYPVSVFVSAMSSTVGAILLIFLAIGFASSLYFIALEGRWPYFGLGFIGVLFFVSAHGLMFIGPACLQLWGFVYIGFLTWVFYRLTHEDASKVYTALLVVLAQFLCMLIATATVGEYGRAEPGFLLRSAVIAGVLLLLCVAPFVVIRFRREATTSTGVSDSSPKGEASHSQQDE
jgi:hypothetical protein